MEYESTIKLFFKLKPNEFKNELDNFFSRNRSDKLTIMSFDICEWLNKLNDKSFNEYEKLDYIVGMIERDNEAVFPQLKKNVLAKVLPNTRHRMSVKIIRTNKCTNCGACNKVCEHISNGVVDRKCIRCLKCVQSCPEDALKFELSPLLEDYLKKPKKNEFLIY